MPGPPRAGLQNIIARPAWASYYQRMMTASGPNQRLRLGVSSCLLGEPVRYDGGHKRDRFITDELSRFADFVPVCPEVECGLPVPREALRLIGDPQDPRLVTVRGGQDLTSRMQRWAQQRLDQLEGEQLDGFIFKRASPSSGMERVKVYDGRGVPHKVGSGLFARAFMARFPLIPTEEEGRLGDPGLREAFVERVFTFARLRQALQGRWRHAQLLDFHTRHKLLLLAHSPAHYRELGRLVATGSKALPREQLLDRYRQGLAAALRLRATPSKHTNVLQHIAGYFKRQLSADEKRELAEILGRYREGQIPLVVPVTLLAHYVRKYDQAYLAGQVYLSPHPLELRLRNHV